jgi:hypothetical protein
MLRDRQQPDERARDVLDVTMKASFMPSWLTTVLALALLALPASPLAQRGTAERAVPFQVGELLSYDVAWSSYVTAATATVTVKERQASGSSAVYDLVAEGRSVGLLDALYPVYYKAESLLDTRTLQPAIATFYSDERGSRHLRTTRFIGPTRIEFEAETGGPRETLTVPAESRDPLSVIFVLRTLPLKAGPVATMPVVDGADVYQTRWQAAGPEPLATPAGRFSAWRLTPSLAHADGQPITAMRITLWLSNDARRLPVKLQAELPIGTFTLALTKIGR